MPQGLQVWDANGNLIIDVTDRLTRVLGEFYTGTSNGSVTNPGLTTGTPWWIAIPTTNINVNNNNMAKYLTFSVSGSTLAWSFGAVYPIQVAINHKVIYGVY